MEWVGGIGVVALFIGAVFLWDYVKDTLKARGGAAGKVMEGTEKVASGISQTISFIIVKGVGVLCLVLAVAALMADGLDAGAKALVVFALGAYGIYLLAPGSSKWVFFFSLR